MELETVQMGAEIRKINFLLENLYAMVLRDAGATHADIPVLSAEMVRQSQLPGTTYGGPANDTDETDAIRELSSARIATFFEHVGARLRSAGL